MKRWQKCSLLAAGLLVLPLLLAALTGYFSSHLRLDYCKEFRAWESGYVGIQEYGLSTSIFRTDMTGEMTGLIRVRNLDLWEQRLQSFEQLIPGSDGDLYVSSTIHGDEAHEDRVIYQVDFTKRQLRAAWEIDQSSLEGVLLQDFSVVDGVLYFTALRHESGNLITYAMERGGAAHPVNEAAAELVNPETCLYTEEGLVCLYRDQGIFLQGRKIYPVQDTGNVLFDALSYEDGVLSFVDRYQKELIRLDLVTGATAVQSLTRVDLQNMQNLHTTSSGGLTASISVEDALAGACWRDGAVQILTNLEGTLDWILMGWILLIASVAEFVLLAAVVLLRRAVLRRIVHNHRRFLSVRARISLISIAVALASTTLVAAMLIRSVNEYSRQRQQIDAANAIESFLGMVAENVTFEAGPDGRFSFSSDFVDTLHEWSRKQRDYGSDYDYKLFSYQQGWQCVYSSDLAEMIPAEYIVDEETLDICQAAYDSGLLNAFQVEQADGRKLYIVSASTQVSEDGLVALAVTDGYDQQVSNLRTALGPIQVSVVACIILLLAENLLIWLFMRRLTRLNRELAWGDAEKGWNITTFPGADEISETSQVLQVMTGSIEQSMKEIRINNAQYERMIPKDVIRLMGAESFVQVHAGQMVSKEGFLLLLSLHQVSDAWLQAGIRTIRESRGYLLKFNSSLISGCFLRREDLAEGIRKMLTDPILAGHVTVFFSPGMLQAGVVGNDSAKRVLVLSEQGKQLQDLCDRMSGQSHLGFFFDPEGLEMDRVLPRCVFRRSGQFDGRPYYELMRVGKETDPNPELTDVDEGGGDESAACGLKSPNGDPDGGEDMLAAASGDSNSGHGG